MTRALLVCFVALVGCGPLAVRAQPAADESQERYIVELGQRNASYGPGCNGIGIALPPPAGLPAEPTPRWIDGHAACANGLRLTSSCVGAVAGDNRLVGCTIIAVEGSTPKPLGCDAYTLLTLGGRFKGDPTASDAAAKADPRQVSCAQPAPLAPGKPVAVAFTLPAATTGGQMALMIDVDGTEAPDFLIPAVQLGGEAGA